MPDEDKNFGGALVLDFRKRWRHVKTIYMQIFTFGSMPVNPAVTSALRHVRLLSKNKRSK